MQLPCSDNSRDAGANTDERRLSRLRLLCQAAAAAAVCDQRARTRHAAAQETKTRNLWRLTARRIFRLLTPYWNSR